MPLGEAIDDPTSNDDYVAQLLASEAKDKSLKYSALGLQAYLPRRPTDRAPKPNTRFLKNILRDTDSHNAALKRKEEEEARERMRKMRGEKSSSSFSRKSHRSERFEDSGRDYRDRSPRRLREERTSARRSHHSSSRERNEDRRSRRQHRRRDGNDSESDRDVSVKSRRRRRDEEKRSRRTQDYSGSPHRSSRHDRGERSDRHRRDKRTDRSRSRSPKLSRHRDDNKHEYREVEEPSSRYSHRRSEKQSEADNEQRISDEESDPLEDLVGPLPVSSRKNKDVISIATRGRGSYRTNTSTIDSHFAGDYDPNLDVDLSENDDVKQKSTRRPVAGLMTEDDDWDMALEALRDRAEWKKKGEERLRVAGFGGDVVERWKKHPAFAIRGSSTPDSEGRIEDVKWAKKGEGREWDRGKVMNADGVYDVKAQW